MLDENIAPSRTSLLKNTLIASLLAAGLLSLVILPAEYGIDPTGFGQVTGLIELSSRESEHQHNASDKPTLRDKLDTPFPNGETNLHDGPPVTRSFEILLQPADEVEYKALLPAGEPIFYRWSVQSDEAIYVDFHGDPTEGEFPEGYSQSYETGEIAGSAGSFTATFTGNHGWYWLNISENEIVINLEVTGYYDSLKEIYRNNQMTPYN